MHQKFALPSFDRTDPKMLDLAARIVSLMPMKIERTTEGPRWITAFFATAVSTYLANTGTPVRPKVLDKIVNQLQTHLIDLVGQHLEEEAKRN